MYSARQARLGDGPADSACGARYGGRSHGRAYGIEFGDRQGSVSPSGSMQYGDADQETRGTDALPVARRPEDSVAVVEPDGEGRSKPRNDADSVVDTGPGTSTPAADGCDHAETGAPP